MAKINRFDGDVVAFGSGALGTERTVFGDVIQSDALDDNINLDFIRGWGIVSVNENPTKQDFNAAMFTATQLLAYLHQMGVAEWNTSQEYHTRSIAYRLGTLYRSVIDSNTGNDPSIDDGTNWVVYGDGPIGVLQYGAVSDGVTDDAAAVTAAEVANDFIYIRSDTKVSTAAASLNGMFHGTGQIIDSTGNRRGRIFSTLKAAPASLGNKDSITTAFDGDLSAQPITMEHRITGADTLGTAAEIITDEYRQFPESSPFYSYMFVQSGRTDDSNNGTGTSNMYIKSINASANGGVVAGITSYGSVTQARTPSGPIDRSAITLFAGQTYANVDNAYLNTTEFHTNDNGFDVTGVGLVLSQRRENNTGAFGAFWSGLRVQSNAGASYVPVDTGISIVGKHLYGLDLTNCVDTVAGVILPADMVIALDGTGNGYIPTAVGGTTVGFNSSTSRLVFKVDTLDNALQVDGSGNTTIPTGAHFRINGQNIIGDRSTGWAAATGTATRTAFDTATVTVSQLAERVKAILDDLITDHGIFGA